MGNLDNMSDFEEKYGITDEERLRIGKEIVSTQMSFLSSQDDPILVITGGQAGAGKNTIVSENRKRFSSSGKAAIQDADRYRTYYPNYEQIVKEFPDTASHHTHKTAASWAVMVGKAGREKNTNIIIDQSSRDIESLRKVSKDFRSENSPYTVEMHVIATPYAISDMRVFGRYENDGGANGGRYVGEDFRKESYQGIANTIESLEKEKLVDRLMVYNSVGKIVYDNQLNADNEWQKQPNGYEVFTAERERELLRHEKEDLVKGWNRIQVQMAERQASPIEYANFQNAITELKYSQDIEILPPSIATPGRTYTGEILAITEDKVFQQTKLGKLIEHDIKNLPGIEQSDFSNTIKIRYEHDNKGKILEGQELSTQQEKNIENEKSSFSSHGLGD